MGQAAFLLLAGFSRIQAVIPRLLCACLLLASAAQAAAQQPRCDKPLGLDDLVSLLEARTSDVRVQQMITDCGTTFQVDDAAERRIRKAGGSKGVVAMARLAARGRSAGAGTSATTPSLTPPAASAPPATSGSSWLRVVRDESSLEQRILEYLKSKDLSVYLNDKPEDLRVWLSYAADAETPAYDISIDTLSSAKEDKERAVQISLYTRQIIDASRYDEVLRHINEHHIGNWAGRFHIDKENEIVGQWHVNIPGDEYPVHMELVHDAVLRLGLSWTPLYRELKPMIDHAR